MICAGRLSLRVSSNFLINITGTSGNATVRMESGAEVVSANGILVDRAIAARPLVFESRTSNARLEFTSSAGFSFSTPTPPARSVAIVMCYIADFVVDVPAVVVHQPAVCDHCINAPCLNGGTCTSKPVGFSCECSPAFNGTLCEADTNECATQNGGCGVAGQQPWYVCLPPSARGERLSVLVLC